MLLPILAISQFSLKVESGIAFPGYNDVRAPNGAQETGTLFSLKDDFDEIENPIYFRAEAMYTIKDKHTFELTAAPLVVEAENYNNPSTLFFEDQEFNGDNINGRYQFNTYRFSYRYRIYNREKFMLDLGATLLTRDAEISITQGNSFTNNTDLGFVPLLSFHTEYACQPNFSFLLKGDALVGPQGRAEDVFLGVRYNPIENIGIRAGYRIIEGGADVDQVYNFALFHFASAGLVYTL